MREQQIKTQKRAIFIGATIIVIFLAGLIIYASQCNLFSDYDVVSVDEVSSPVLLEENAEKNTVYYFDAMVIADRYASYGDVNKDDDVYYLVVFRHEGSLYSASLEVPTTESIYPHIESYINDDSQAVGDFIVPVCATTQGMENSQLWSYYDEAVEVYRDVFDEQEILDMHISLKYACDTPYNIDAYKSSESKQDTYVCLMILAFIIFFAIMLIGSIKKLKRLQNQTDAEVYEQAVNNTPNYQPADTGNSTQTGEYYNPSQSQYFNPMNNNDNNNEE